MPRQRITVENQAGVALIGPADEAGHCLAAELVGAWDDAGVSHLLQQYPAIAWFDSSYRLSTGHELGVSMPLQPTGQRPHDLTFIDMDHAGRVAFIKALQDTGVDSDDVRLQALQQKYGAYNAARNWFAWLAAIDYDPDSWLLAIDQSEQLVGLAVPRRLSPGTGYPAYVAVVPRVRGEQLEQVLASECMRTLEWATTGEVWHYAR